MTVAIESSMREMISHILDAHYDEPDEPSHRAVWIDLTLDHVGDSADVELARSGVWSGTLAEWREVGPGIVRRVPLVRVELADRYPSYTDDTGEFRDDLRGHYCWFLYDGEADEPFCQYYLPPAWYPHSHDRYWIPAGKTEELALADASQRAIAWARRTEVTP